MKDRLHFTLGRRLACEGVSDPKAVELARAAAVEGKGIREDTQLLERLVAADFPWVLEHTAEIARTSRKAWGLLLRAVNDWSPPSVGPVAKVLVDAELIDGPAIRRHVKRNMDWSATESLDEALGPS